MPLGTARADDARHPLRRSRLDAVWTLPRGVQCHLLAGTGGGGRHRRGAEDGMKRVTGEDALPGDAGKDELIERIIRVDQAGEFGAVRIYEGQMAVLRPGEARTRIGEMAAKEREHLEAFNRLMVERRVRPTLLSPLWHMAGFALGAATAFLGERAAMACTVAVEEVMPVSARLIVNQAALKTRPAQLQPIIGAFAKATQDRQ